MYVDLILFVVLLILVIMFFKKLWSVVFFIAIFDILFRILTFVKNNIAISNITGLIGKYVPNGVYGIITKYTNGMLTTILCWIYVIIMTLFLVYICKIFLKKRRI